MPDTDQQHASKSPQPPVAPADLPDTEPGTRFHGWRLLGVIGAVVLLIAGASALLDLFLRPR